KLMKLQLPKQDSPSLAQAADGRRVFARNAVLEHPRVPSRPDPTGVEQVLEGDRNAGEGSTRRARGELTVEPRRIELGLVLRECDEGTNDRIDSLDPIAIRLDDLRDADLSLADDLRQLRDR